VKNWRKTLAWACCLLLVFTICGWTANKVYKRFFIVEEKILVEEEVAHPDGSKGFYSQSRSVSIGSNAPDFTGEKANKMYREVQALLSRGEYEFAGVKELDSGAKAYLYRFTLADGEELMWATRRPPLVPEEGKGTSYRELLDLFAQGKGELLRTEKSDSGGNVYIYRITRADGTGFTFASEVPIEGKK